MNAKQLAVLVIQKRGKSRLEDVASLTGVSMSTLSRIENERGWPDSETLARLSLWLHVPISTLAADDGQIVEIDQTTPGKIDAALFADPALSLADALKLSEMMRAAYRAMVSEGAI